MKQKIPHIINYFWFGNNPKPHLVNCCIESWSKYFQDWEIKEWNENNYNVNKDKYIKQAYEAGKWAFVSDYARCDILEQYGGLYFDTDVEVLKKFSDEVMQQIAFTGVESSNKVSPGLVFCCPPHFWLMKEMMDSYRKSEFVNYEGKNRPMTINERMTNLLVEKGYVVNGMYQCIDGLAIYRSEVFCAYDQSINEPCITELTIARHHYLGSWKKKTIKQKVQKRIKKIVGIKNYRRFLMIKRKFFGISE